MTFNTVRKLKQEHNMITNVVNAVFFSHTFANKMSYKHYIYANVVNIAGWLLFSLWRAALCIEISEKKVLDARLNNLLLFEETRCDCKD